MVWYIPSSEQDCVRFQPKGWNPLVPSFGSGKKVKEEKDEEEEEEEEDDDNDVPRQDLAWLEQGCISRRKPHSLIPVAAAFPCPGTGSDCAADEDQQMEAAFTSHARAYVSEEKLY